MTVDGLEKERDFYFGKLRDIELICQEHKSEKNPVLAKIIDILYATEVMGPHSITELFSLEGTGALFPYFSTLHLFGRRVFKVNNEKQNTHKHTSVNKKLVSDVGVMNYKHNSSELSLAEKCHRYSGVIFLNF